MTDVLLLGIVVIYSTYAFVYATLLDSIDYKVMLLLSCLAVLARVRGKASYVSREAHCLYAAFLGLTGLSVFMPFSRHANVQGLVDSVAMLLLGSAIVAGFMAGEAHRPALLKRGLAACLLTLALGAMLSQHAVPIKAIFPSFGEFRPVSITWNQKYYSFWLVFLLWGTVAVQWSRTIGGALRSIALIAAAGVVLSSGYSHSAPFALGLSIVIFLVMQVPLRAALRVWQAAFALYILAFPWVWSVLPDGWLGRVRSIGLQHAAYRVDLYGFTVRLIKEQWLFGYGFGSAAPLMKPFPHETGGHPHNLVLFVWLELGLLGALLVALAVTRFFGFIDGVARERGNAPAVWALVGAGAVIFSFSFDIWLPGVVLTYAMWLAMIMLAATRAR